MSEIDDFIIELPDKEEVKTGVAEVKSATTEVSKPENAINNKYFSEKKDIVLDDIDCIGEDGIYGDFLKGTDITDAISGETVRSVVIPERAEVSTKSCMIDITNVTTKTSAALSSIRLCLSEESDTHGIEVYIKFDETVRGIGFGCNDTFYRLFPDLIQNLFNGEATLYMNNGKGFKKYSSLDASIIKLKLI